MRQTFGLNYTNADVLYKAWKDPNKSDEDYKNLYEGFKDKPLPNANSPELQTAKISEEIKNMYTQLGQTHLDKNFEKLVAEHQKIKVELINALRGEMPHTPVIAPSARDVALLEGGNVPLGGVISESSERDYKNQMSFIMPDITGPYNSATIKSPDVKEVYEAFYRMTGGKNGNDMILDKSEVGQLIPLLSKIAENKGISKEDFERLIEKLNVSFTVEVP
jgi:hypothetical protein